MKRFLALLALLGLGSLLLGQDVIVVRHRVSPPAGGITFVQKNSCASNATATTSCSLTSVTAGNMIYAVGCTTFNNQPGSSGAADDKSGVYTSRNNSFYCRAFESLNAAGGTTTVTLTWATSSGGMMTLVELAGVPAASAFDIGTNTFTPGTTWTSGNLTTTNAADTLIGHAYCNAQTNCGYTVGTSWSLTACSAGADTCAVDYQYAPFGQEILIGLRKVTATGTYTWNGTASVATGGNGGVGSWKAQ